MLFNSSAEQKDSNFLRGVSMLVAAVLSKHIKSILTWQHTDKLDEMG